MKPPVQHMLEAPHALRMHMPGHKGKLPPEWIHPAFDTTELPDTDDLFAPVHGIARAERLAAKAAGAAHTICLTGGATAGNLAMLLYALRPGDAVILPRNAHVSAISGCILAGAEPIYVWPRYTASGMCYIHSPDVLEAVREHPKVRAVLLTRPDYYGLCTPLEEIAEECRGKSIRLLVDEAHGAHINWMREGVPGAAVSGAHLWVQSAHKTLPVLTGGAWLHVAESEDAEALRRVLRLVHSSSPSFLVLNTLDRARDWMDSQGEDALRQLSERICGFWRTVESIPGIADGQANAPLPVDRLRLVLDVSGRGITGWTALAALEKLGVAAEMADERRVVMIPTVWDAPGDLAQVADCLQRLPTGAESFHQELQPAPRAPQRLPLRQVALAKQVLVPIEHAESRIAAASVGIYPPGIPALVPGEGITGEMVDYLRRQTRAGAVFFGLRGGMVPCVDEGE